MTITLDAKVPAGPLADKWDNHKFDLKLVAPNNRRRFDVIVVGTGLAGASAAASLGEMGYNVKVFTYHDSPRRAHSIAAQGGINAAKNYRNDGDSVHRLFYDTIKGGDYRSREGNVYRLAQVSTDIIDQCAAQGVPFAREYGGLLDNRSFGGAQVSRTFYARGQTGQQLLLGAYQALARQIHLGTVELFNRMDMLDLVLDDDGKACGIIARDLLTGETSRHNGHAVVLATGGYGNVYFLSTNAKACNVTATWRAHRKGAAFANPCYTQIHPTCIPASDEFQSKLTLMSESLRNDGRIWVPKSIDDCGKVAERRSPRATATTTSSGSTRASATSSPATSRPATPRRWSTRVTASGPLRNGVYLDFADSIARLGEDTVRERYGNLFDMYERITGENPYQVPMRIYPATHYTMGGLWVDYNLMSNVPGLFVLGEANFSDHGANRLGASALMQGLADGYFVIPATIAGYLAGQLGTRPAPVDHAVFDTAENEVNDRVKQLTVGQGHAVGRPLPPRARQDRVGVLRHGAQQDGPREGAVGDPRAPRAVLEGRQGPRRRPDLQPVAREGAARRRLHGDGRAEGARRARPRGVVRRALPRGAPDARGRGPARRRALRLRRRVGVRRTRHPDRRDPQQGTARVRERRR